MNITRGVKIFQLCKPKEDKNEVFTKMKEAQPLVVVSKSAVDGAAQYLFNFFKLGNLILKQGMKYVVIIGFRKRAKTVLVDPNTLFRFLTKNRTFPLSKTYSRAGQKRNSRT